MLILNVFNVFDIGILFQVFISTYILLMFVDIYWFFIKKEQKEDVRSLKKSRYDLVEYFISYSILVVSIIIVSALFIGTLMKIQTGFVYSTLSIIFSLLFIGLHLFVFVFELMNINKEKLVQVKLEYAKIRLSLFQVLILMYDIVYLLVYTTIYLYRSEIEPSILSLFIVFPPILILIIQGLYQQKRNEYIILKEEVTQ